MRALVTGGSECHRLGRSGLVHGLLRREVVSAPGKFGPGSVATLAAGVGPAVTCASEAAVNSATVADAAANEVGIRGMECLESDAAGLDNAGTSLSLVMMNTPSMQALSGLRAGLSGSRKFCGPKSKASGDEANASAVVLGTSLTFASPAAARRIRVGRAAQANKVTSSLRQVRSRSRVVHATAVNIPVGAVMLALVTGGSECRRSAQASIFLTSMSGVMSAKSDQSEMRDGVVQEMNWKVRCAQVSVHSPKRCVRSMFVQFEQSAVVLTEQSNSFACSFEVKAGVEAGAYADALPGVDADAHVKAGSGGILSSKKCP